MANENMMKLADVTFYVEHVLINMKGSYHVSPDSLYNAIKWHN